MTEYVKKSDVLELLSLPKDLIAEYVCDLKGLWIDDDEAEPNNCEDCIWTVCNYNKAFKDEPQTDCNGCKFVGTYHTEFPCANCSRKTKDYYAKDEPQTERSSK